MGELVLEPLEAPDRLTELPALLGVGDRQVGDVLRPAERVGRDQHQRSIADASGERIATPAQVVRFDVGKGHPRHRAAAVGRGNGRDFHSVTSFDQAQAAVFGIGEEQRRSIGRLHELRTHGERRHRFTSRERRQLGKDFGVVARRNRHCREDLADHRSGRDRLADHLADQRCIEQSQPGTAVLLGQGDPANAQRHQCLPARGVEVGVAIGEGVEALHRPAVGQRPAHGVLDRSLLIAKMKVHRYFSALIARSRGKPSPRSPMMLRWMLLAPPAIELPRLPMI